MRASDHASDGRSIQHDKISQIQPAFFFSCVEINCYALHAIDAMLPRECVGSMAWGSLVYLRTAEVTGILKDVFMS